MVQPTAYEQYMLELINRARKNPQQEANRYGIGLNDNLPNKPISNIAKQPLAFNLDLIESSRTHSQWLLNNNQFTHSGANNSSAGDRMENAGYVFTGSWTWGENLAWRGTTSIEPDNIKQSVLNNDKITVKFFTDDWVETFIALQHESLFKSAGHRENTLNDDFREIGIGSLQGDFNSDGVVYPFSLMTTENFAKSGSSLFLTGVVYQDTIRNDNFYTVGEGKGAISVKAVRQSDGVVFNTTTYNSGGYQIPLTAGVYDVNFSGSALSSAYSETVTINNQNVKLDLRTDEITQTNSPPEKLRFSLPKTNFFAGEVLTLVDNTAWVYDKEGTTNLSRIDFWLRAEGKNWQDIKDATNFVAWTGGNEWSSFDDYQLSLNGYSPGNYTLLARAFDRNGNMSNKVTKNITLDNYLLRFDLPKNTSQGDKVSVTNGWINHGNSKDIAKVDFWLRKQGGTWQDIADAKTINPWSGGKDWSNFAYELDLSGYQQGNYELWAIATDHRGNSSNAVRKNITISESRLTFDLSSNTYGTGGTLKIQSGWVLDYGGTSELEEVDFWLKKQGTQNWQDIKNAKAFTPWNQGDHWSSFAYELDLTNYSTGTYELWAIATDIHGNQTNSVRKTFELISLNNPDSFLSLEESSSFAKIESGAELTII